MLLQNKEETKEISTETFKPNETECDSGPLYAHQVLECWQSFISLSLSQKMLFSWHSSQIKGQ